ncbi:MAG: amidohydrolase family protein [Chloroflexi bacterium]|nr:amidohydrolase family protein [Chloroflexota bacterium]
MITRDRRPADLVVANARVITLDPRRPTAEALAARDGRVVAVGALDELRACIGPYTEVVDSEGGFAVPAFHDAHLHLLSFARTRSRIDCRQARSIGVLRGALIDRARQTPGHGWIRAFGYDDALLAEGRHPDRHDLDAAVADRPVRVQHRTLHVDVLNTRAFRLLGLWEANRPEVEREPATGEPTGRLYHAAEMLRGRVERAAVHDLAADVRAASEQLLAWGITTVQDASVTNGGEEWELFHNLVDRGDLQVRVFVCPGAEHWRTVLAAQPESGRVRLGPVKLMLDERTSDPREVRARVAEARGAGRSVALHAVSEAEVAIALDALRGSSAPPRRALDRIEHGSVIPDAWLDDLRAIGAAVVGQPALVYDRGDVYRTAYPPDLHGWLHRARSLVAAGVPYAVGSDAPVTDPAPGLALFALQRRTTRGGSLMARHEALTAAEALAACTLWPARVVGADGELGSLRPGALADLAVLDADVLETPSAETRDRQARMTIVEGRVVWRRGARRAGPQ